MEAVKTRRSAQKLGRTAARPEAPGRSEERSPSKEPFISDAVLDELKRLSTAGCLLCAFDELDDDDWE